MPMLKAMLAGAILVSAWAISVFFMRFWRKTHDPLFAFFAAAFLLLGIERIGMLVFAGGTEGSIYLIRLVAFVLILAGIIGKNRRGNKL
ncbi:MAG TPA: DUF5985 family protein [Verrucomicrobiae bacterium]|nr:DUF5985 family protein [Verrucomicrobiae bacterium]